MIRQEATADMATTPYACFFIEPDELAGKLDSGTVKILDGSYYLPAMKRDAAAEFSSARIPGAQFFDIDVIANHEVSLPHMVPTPEVFAKAAGEMGISETDEIVVYDGPGLFSAARVWWTFRIMGAKNVRILAGGFDRWKSADYPVETGRPKEPSQAVFNAVFDDGRVADFGFMLGNIKKGEALVLDARPYGRFTGEAPEPRAELKGGHIPGSRSLPATDLVIDGRMLPAEQLEEKIRLVGADRAKHIITTCGSGVTAAIITLALEMTGHTNHSLYDGSWVEWGSREDAPIARWK